MAMLKGIVLGGATIFAIAVLAVLLLLAARLLGDPSLPSLIEEQQPHTLLLVAMLGPPIGGVTGLLAGALAGHPPLVRLAILMLPLLGLVLFLASRFSPGALDSILCAPPLAAVFILERSTRRTPPDAAVPVATALPVTAARATRDGST